MATVIEINEALAAKGYSFMHVRKCKHGFFIEPKEAGLYINNTITMGAKISTLTVSDVEAFISKINIDVDAIKKHLVAIEASHENERETAKQALADNHWEELQECAVFLAVTERNILFLKQVIEQAENKVHVCGKCGTPVVFENVSPGYEAVCPKEDEDLYSFEIVTK